MGKIAFTVYPLIQQHLSCLRVSLAMLGYKAAFYTLIKIYTCSFLYLYLKATNPYLTANRCLFLAKGANSNV